MNNSKRWVLICLIAFAALSFAASARVGWTAEPLVWTKENVIGLRMSLIDPEATEEMYFGPDHVDITFGTKDLVAGMGFKWKIVDGKLLVLRYNNGVDKEMALVSRDPSRIVVLSRLVMPGNTGKLVNYEVRQNPQ